MRRRLVLFDIDGTLLKPQGLGRRSLERAFEERFGRAGFFEGVAFHGRVDGDIVAEGVRRAGGSPDDAPRLLERYLEHLEAEVAASGPLALPGVHDVLARLAAAPGVALGLVTGNVKRGAWIKLGRDGLRDYFRFGAFGDDHLDRGELVRLAVRRAAEGGHAPEGPRAAFHVGDTESDVRAARFGGVGAVAVATGGCTAETLAALAPDHLFTSLAPADAFVEALLA
ncbi:MAG TPA: HAD family hydrolase [Planctomycetota bacterium]|nr:HAD family hydrolase [Planctomycetota bacterium]